MEKAKHWINDGLSMNETRVSVIMLSFIVTLGFSLWQFYNDGVIDGSILTLIAYEIGAITGINIVDKIGNKNNDVGM